MKRIGMVLVVLAVLSVTTAGFADCGVCNAAASDSYFTKFGGQLGRGAANLGLGWVELFNQPVQEVKANGASHIVIGIGKGIGHTLIRMVQGVGEIVTSPMPRAQGGHYTQIAQDCPVCGMGSGSK